MRRASDSGAFTRAESAILAPDARLVAPCAPVYPSPRPYRRFRQLLKLSEHWKSAQSGDHSFAGEAKQIEALLERLGVRGGYVVDVAASDGVSQSCTVQLFRDPRWAGLAVEMESEKFAKLAFAYAGFDGVQLAKCRVTPRTIAPLLEGHEVPRDFTFLNLDIDSYDLPVMDAMLKGGFRPRIVSMEVNEKIPPPLFFTVRYDDAHYWQGDHFYGCSIVAAASTLKPYGYVLDSMQYNNAIFVEAAFGSGRVKDLSPEEAYRIGYADRPERKTMFPWNANVEEAIGAPPEKALAFFDRFFEKYRGKYELRVDAAAASRVAPGP
jgi:hypothetical protein